ncbi:MAG: DUF4382 domain-containing protein, partial [Thermoanaerobaculia bacterium]
MKNQSCQKTVRIIASIGFCAAVVFSVTSCNSGSSPTDPAGDSAAAGGGTGVISPSSGTLQILMIDAPTDELCELVVFIKDLRVKPEGQPQMRLGTELGEFDLLLLQDGAAAVLGPFEVDQTRYQFIEILLDESRSYVIEKDPTDPTNTNCLLTESVLQIPSAKFKVAGGPFEVDNNTTITIDFDADKSLKKKGGNSGKDKGWQLKPDVSITNVQ